MHPATWLRVGLAVIAVMAGAAPARAEKIGTVVTVLGNDVKPLSGMGLVMGLNGTGDKSAAALKQIQDYMIRYNLNMKTSDLATGNLALVVVTAYIYPSNAVGQRVEARVSAVNGAKSLRGGYLMETPLQYGNATGAGQTPIYARAFGKLTVAVEDPCNAYLPVSEMGGALVMRTDADSDWDAHGVVQLNLKTPSYADAVEIVTRINASPVLNPPPPGRAARGFSTPVARAAIARAIGSARIRVQIPANWTTREPEFLAILMDIDVSLESPPSIRINEATGDIFILGDVRVVRRATVGKNGRTVTLTPPVEGQPRTYEGQPAQALVELAGPGTNPDLEELINTLNAMGLTSREVASLFKGLVQQGAIRAKLIEE